jgi:hypothetical protein
MEFRIRRVTGVVALVLCASACGDRDPQPPQPGQPQRIEQPQPIAQPPVSQQPAPSPQPAPLPQPPQVARERAIVPAPQPLTRCIDPEPDSAAAAAAAIGAIPEGGPFPLRVSSFTRHHDGALISVLPVATDVVGGGGLVWVDRDGCITVIKLHE